MALSYLIACSQSRVINHSIARGWGLQLDYISSSMTVTAQFQDRYEAGRFLAGKLEHHSGDPSLIVLALPRGGIPVGYEVAKALNAPLDIFLVRKLGVPGGEELAMGAIASGDIKVLNEEVIRMEGISDRDIESVYEKEREELRRRELAYRGNA